MAASEFIPRVPSPEEVMAFLKNEAKVFAKKISILQKAKVPASMEQKRKNLLSMAKSIVQKIVQFAPDFSRETSLGMLLNPYFLGLAGVGMALVYKWNLDYDQFIASVTLENKKMDVQKKVYDDLVVNRGMEPEAAAQTARSVSESQARVNSVGIIERAKELVSTPMGIVKVVGGVVAAGSLIYLLSAITKRN